jgi:hypothetical protein
MEGKFIFINLCLLFVLSALLIQKYKKVYETYSDYFNEELFRTIDEKSEFAYTDDPNASVCFDRYKASQELGTVNANNLYLNYRKEISKGKFKTLLTELNEAHKNLLEIINCDYSEDLNPTTLVATSSSSPAGLCMKKKRVPIGINTYDLCKKWLLDRINEKMILYDQTTDYDHIPFTIQRDVILSFKQIQNDIRNIDYFNFLLTINREGKNKVFTVNAEMFFDKNTDRKSIISLNLDGLTTNENSLSGFMEFHRNAYYNCDNNGVSCTLSERPECKPPSNEEVARTAEEEAEESRRSRDSKCFYKEAENEAECISIDVNGCSGVWDTKCSVDTDCPFFGAKGNTNYTNDRGGCKADGHCEMPLNMINIGYRKYSTRDEDRPLCHNCPNISNCIGKECSQCCDLQGENPDYAFEFDKPFRERERGPYKEKLELEEKGLKYFDLYF